MDQKQTFAPQKAMSALPPKADMCGAIRDVRFGPKADMGHPILMGGVNHFYFFILLRPPKKPPIVAPAHIPNATLTNMANHNIQP
jgi:hypothetical protein